MPLLSHLHQLFDVHACYAYINALRGKDRCSSGWVTVERQGFTGVAGLGAARWGQERIANELLLKLGLRVSPRTVRKDMPSHCVGAQANAVSLSALTLGRGLT